MFRQKRRAFTIVELLVVVSIVVLLMGLLLPAVQMARESARRVQCTNNIRTCSQAATLYTSAQGYYPASRAYSPGCLLRQRAGQVGPTVIYPWSVLLLNEFGEGSLATAFDQIDKSGGDPFSNAQITAKRIKILFCPSDNSAQAVETAISYACNGGLENVLNNNPIAVDWQSNGCFDDRVRDFAQRIINQTSPADITDGASNTIMFCENVCLNSWTQVSEYDVAVLWQPTTTPAVAFSADKLLNQANLNHAQPNSFHSGGFNVGMCDGSIKFTSNKMAYDVYMRLMSSNGSRVWPAGYRATDALPAAWTTALPFQAGTATVQQIQATPTSPSDYE